MGCQFLPPRNEGAANTVSPFTPSAAAVGSPGRPSSTKTGQPSSPMPSVQVMSFTKGQASTKAPSSRFST